MSLQPVERAMAQKCRMRGRATGIARRTDYRRTHSPSEHNLYEAYHDDPERLERIALDEIRAARREPLFQ